MADASDCSSRFIERPTGALIPIAVSTDTALAFRGLGPGGPVPCQLKLDVTSGFELVGQQRIVGVFTIAEMVARTNCSTQSANPASFASIGRTKFYELGAGGVVVVHDIVGVRRTNAARPAIDNRVVGHLPGPSHVSQLLDDVCDHSWPALEYRQSVSQQEQNQPQVRCRDGDQR